MERISIPTLSCKKRRNRREIDHWREKRRRCEASKRNAEQKETQIRSSVKTKAEKAKTDLLHKVIDCNQLMFCVLTLSNTRERKSKNLLTVATAVGRTDCACKFATGRFFTKECGIRRARSIERRSDGRTDDRNAFLENKMLGLFFMFRWFLRKRSSPSCRRKSVDMFSLSE